MNFWMMFLVVFVTFWFMEFVAWATHKYVMHGFLWVLHKDHHVKEPGVLEKNDSFFLIFAIPSWLCIMLGMMNQNMLSVMIGVGIALYGIAYFLVHEIFIHQRLKFFRNTDSFYFKVIRRAHKMHHKHLSKEDGESFGMLLVAPRYWKQELERQEKQKKRAAHE